MKSNIPRILIGGSGSGCGKTTITCGLLSALKMKKLNIAAFKCGPDYIDPMFHSEILETSSKNLDVVLCDENTVKTLFSEGAKNADIAVIEGVMGIFDGVGFDDDIGSANHIARLIKAPELLVLNVRGKGHSLAAEAMGYIGFTDNNIKGFILNNCSSAMYPIYEKLILEKTGLKCYGYMPSIPEAKIESRHLGLITAAEIDDLKDKIKVLGENALKTLNIDEIIRLAQSGEELLYTPIKIRKGKPVKIGIAKDKAFCFYYRDNLELLENLGAEFVEFSPIKDEKLPDDISGIIIGGGYPEVYIKEISENKSMKESIHSKCAEGIPVYAECGGFMYLGRSISDGDNTYETVGVINGNSHITKGLIRFGYKTLTANEDNLLCKKGESIKCHEFHYSDTDEYGDGFTSENKRGKSWQTGVTTETMYAGYPHLHLWSNIKFAENFMDKCRQFAIQNDIPDSDCDTEDKLGGIRWN